MDAKTDIIIFSTCLVFFYIVSVCIFLSHRRKKQKRLQLEHDVIFAKRQELKETDVEEYLNFKAYSEKRMEDGLQNS
ncbi:MAG: hypothetical protein AAF518_07490 [Spirochaetota bacterium]